MDIKLTFCVHKSCEPEITGTALSWEEQLQYKYILDADGLGSVFRSKHLLISGSLVFKIDTPIAQFWATEIRPWIHFVPVSWHDLEDDLPRKVKWAMEHDAEAQRIMLNGHRWVMTHLTDANVAWFQEQALNAIAQRQAEEFPPIPGAAKFCCNHLEGADPHYRSKCIEYAPQHMLTCDTQPNAFKIACTGTS
ncbi:hypothetical protein CHLNCDRAFT_33034 [Chlorella variabilis]|uniref:Glycosyl transferase CAP10 domain-containing protein n=1 Tax=Chlorella variabilis TaxID=554065 RepID=E1ZRN9_CHLVA|nr:hypothetical protein CHLNCDRAFT_33034 [Chlorella variabilis]EFN51444.1 hypothetical protein CHLNCDRAFT_33034 [Chlorella variabilis]|eukprot:XP_005843546.1 hypothetical protein CHLNCDRAFT_33034 [Chlorella variabilis]